MTFQKEMAWCVPKIRDTPINNERSQFIKYIIIKVIFRRVEDPDQIYQSSCDALPDNKAEI